MIKLKNIIKESEQPSPMHNEARRHFLEIISTYKAFAPKLQAEVDLVEIAETLGGIVDAAHTFTMKEAGNHFDPATVKRNMNELNKLNTAFEKAANEAKQLQQRLASMYEDMGYVLGKYFELGEISEDEAMYRLGHRKPKVESTKLRDLMPEAEGPCWKGYQQIGMKMKNGRQVPNCVPKNEVVKENTNDCGCNK